MVDLTIGVLARPDVKLLPTIYRQLGKDYLERVLPSIATEVIKSVVVSFNPEEREGNTGNSPPEGVFCVPLFLHLLARYLLDH